MTFEDSVEKNLSRCLVAAGAATDAGPQVIAGIKLLLGLSGGIDSTALLLALNAIRKRSWSESNNESGDQSAFESGFNPGFELFACHVNHHLRGADAIADEEYCRELCRKLQVPLIVVNLDTTVKNGEAELRAARYKQLLHVARQLAAPYIVTAHNLDDQVETLIFRLIRGTSSRGLVGISPARPLYRDAQWPILLRPLLTLSRVDVERYLAEQSTFGRLDLSNNDIKYSRNFLRSQIISPLKQRFPGLLSNVEHFRLTLQSENDYLTEQAGDLYGRALTISNKLLLSVLDGEHPALVCRVIAKYIEQAGIMPSFQRVGRVVTLIDQARASVDRDFGARVSLGENLELLVSKDSILLKPLYELSSSAEEYQGRLKAMLPVAVKMPGQGRSSAITMVPWLNYAVTVEGASGSGAEPVKPFDRSAFAVFVNLTGLKEAIYIRPRRPGDHIQPAGMQGKVRLKQYLHANKTLFAGARVLLPGLNDVLALRLCPVLVSADSQEVLWVPGFGLSEKIKARGDSSHLIALIPLTHSIPDEVFGALDGGTC